MTSLTADLVHYRAMATAEHQLECRGWTPCGGWRLSRLVYPDPDCGGCVTDADRALFTRLADEIDDYLGRGDEEGLFA